MKLRRLRFIDAQLNDGNVGVRKYVAEHRPCAVIESPLMVSVCSQQRLQTRGELQIASRRILHFIQLARKTAEVVDRARMLHRSDERQGQIPMRRNHHDRLWPRHRFSDRAPNFCVSVLLDRVHRIAMPKEDRRRSHYALTGSPASRSIVAIARST